MKLLKSGENGRIAVGSLIVILIVLGIAVSQHSRNNEDPLFVSSSPPVQSVADIRQQIIDQVKIKELNWYKSGVENIMMVNVTFENAGASDVEDIELTCDDYSNSGTKIHNNSRIIYEVVKAGKSKHILNVDMGFIDSQAVSASCRITNLAVL
jgi:hypothetical protein